MSRVPLIAAACALLSCKVADSSVVARLDCTALAGTQLTVTQPDGAVRTHVVGACAYAVSSRGAVLQLASAQGNAWIYWAGRDLSARYALADSTLGAALEAGGDPAAVLARLDAQGIGSGTVMISVFETTGGSNGWYQSYAGGEITPTLSTASGTWPRLVGERGRLSAMLSGARLRPDRADWAFATLEARIDAQLDVSDQSSGADALDAGVQDSASAEPDGSHDEPDGSRDAALSADGS